MSDPRLEGYYLWSCYIGVMRRVMTSCTQCLVNVFFNVFVVGGSMVVRMVIGWRKVLSPSDAAESDAIIEVYQLS